MTNQLTLRATSAALSHSYRSERGPGVNSSHATITCVFVHRTALAARHSSVPSDQTT
ncbi:hypothetical protein [Cellulomonas septica]|uniref:Uncharacterized protein n=1 Tax=Cellulomonas septica TaxID=285080 RepID=A0ABX1JVQ2_9CELL|nr:hypothetical protein [Cellulomonas septica]NKY38044.1 hypothetical protein [Cellulomonas septica]